MLISNSQTSSIQNPVVPYSSRKKPFRLIKQEISNDRNRESVNSNSLRGYYNVLDPAVAQKNTSYLMKANAFANELYGIVTGSNTFSLTVNGVTKNLNVTIGGADTVKEAQENLATTINNANFGVSATVQSTMLDYTEFSFLEINATQGGEDYSFTLADDDGNIIAATGSDIETTWAQNASLIRKILYIPKTDFIYDGNPDSSAIQSPTYVVTPKNPFSQDLFINKQSLNSGNPFFPQTVGAFGQDDASKSIDRYTFLQKLLFTESLARNLLGYSLVLSVAKSQENNGYYLNPDKSAVGDYGVTPGKNVFHLKGDGFSKEFSIDVSPFDNTKEVLSNLVNTINHSDVPVVAETKSYTLGDIDFKYISLNSVSANSNSSFSLVDQQGNIIASTGANNRTIPTQNSTVLRQMTYSPGTFVDLYM